MKIGRITKGIIKAALVALIPTVIIWGLMQLADTPELGRGVIVPLVYAVCDVWFSMVFAIERDFDE